MSPPPDHPTYRIRRVRDAPGDAPPGYQYTLTVSDEGDPGRILARCAVARAPIHAEHVIRDGEDRPWTLKPNRRIAPTRWVIADPQAQVATQIDQNVVGKLLNPFTRSGLLLLDADGAVDCRVRDPRASVADRVLGVGPDEWSITRDDRLVGKLVILPGSPRGGRGLLGALGDLATAADQGIVSLGREHLFPAPVALGMLLIWREVTDVSGG